MAWKLYDFIDSRGRNLVTEWIRGLPNVVIKARIKAKLQTIVSAGADLPPNMVTPTTERSIKEIVVNTRFGAFRLFTCRGPTDPRSELTLLSGGQEKDSRYLDNTPADAEQQRQELIQNVNERRRIHEYFKGLLG